MTPSYLKIFSEMAPPCSREKFLTNQSFILVMNKLIYHEKDLIKITNFY